MDQQQLLLLVGAVVAALALVAVAIVLARRGRGPKAPPGLAPERAERKEERRGEEAPLPVQPAPAPLPVEKPTSWSDGLARTRRGGFVSRIAGILGRKEIDPALLGELEEVLLTADIGVKTAQKLFDSVKARLDREHLREGAAVYEAIKDESRRLLDVEAPPFDATRAKPFVILMIGVNGVGKTTTIGKLAARFASEGLRVLLAAGDTFRAAATEQLEIWAQRTGVEIVKGREGGDPSSVIFDAVKRGRDQGYDVVICDTAGRLHTKSDLMHELQKVRRVVQKVDAAAPHETMLVLDATNGQNAIAQAQMFKQAMDIGGIVLTKLDGTAKGGVILGICDELKVPVRFVGVGEKIADLRPFDSNAFVEALYQREEAA